MASAIQLNLFPIIDGISMAIQRSGPQTRSRRAQNSLFGQAGVRVPSHCYSPNALIRSLDRIWSIRADRSYLAYGFRLETLLGGAVLYPALVDFWSFGWRPSSTTISGGIRLQHKRIR